MLWRSPNYYKNIYVNCRHNGNKHEPEPQEDIDFFIYDIQRENAETIYCHDTSTGTILVEYTLCDLNWENIKHRNISHTMPQYFWEHMGHWVVSLSWRLLRNIDKITAIGCKFSAKEEIHEEDLTNDIDQV